MSKSIPKPERNALIDEVLANPNIRVNDDGTIDELVDGKWQEGRIREDWVPTPLYLYKKVPLAVCRIVYRKFHGEFKAGEYVWHIDGNSHNNEASNLRQMTRSRASRLWDKSKRGRNPKLSFEDAKEIREKYKTGAYRSYEVIAKQYGVSCQTARKVVHNILWTDEDYVFEKQRGSLRDFMGPGPFEKPQCLEIEGAKVYIFIVPDKNEN